MLEHSTNNVNHFECLWGGSMDCPDKPGNIVTNIP